ncbi:MAG TPA: hypothetical protein VF407_25505 [Polyangiaceae bacterium]
MRNASLFALPLLSVLAVACGGQVGSTPTGGDSDHTADPNPHSNDDDTSSKSLPVDTIDGSFDLTFTKVTAIPSVTGANPQVDPPSRSANARLDVKDGANPIVTPRWGRQTHLTLKHVDAVPKHVELDMPDDGTFVVFGGSSNGYTTVDRITEISLGVTAKGGYDGTFTASGTEEIVSGDVAYEASLSIMGTIGVDVTTPDWKLEPIPAGGLLPWSPTVVHLSEPVVTMPYNPMGSVIHLEYGAFNAPSQGPNVEDDDALVVKSVLGAWLNPQARLEIDGLFDPTYNFGDIASTTITYADVGLPTASYTFDGGTPPPTFGDAGALVDVHTDSTCETGGCVAIGAIERSTCSTPSLGIAGILKTPSAGASTLHVRYRVLVGVDPTYAGSDAQPVAESSAFVLESAAPGVMPTTTNIGFATTDLQTIPSTLGFTQATDWKTIDAPIAANAAQNAGFAVKVGSSPCAGGPIYDPNRFTILVDSVTVD